MSGTRRMWSRRVLRAGWMIAPIFTFPKRAYKHFLCDRQGKFAPENLVLSVVVCSVVSGVSLMIYTMATEHKPAKASYIVEVMKEDACMADLVPRRAQEKGAQPMSNYEIDRAQADCDKATSDYYAQLEQQKVFEEQRKVMGVKK